MEKPMEQRIGSILILLQQKQASQKLNDIITEYSNIIIGRQGIPLTDRGFSLISLIVIATPAQMGALAGKLGRVSGLRVKTAVIPQEEINSISE